MGDLLVLTLRVVQQVRVPCHRPSRIQGGDSLASTGAVLSPSRLVVMGASRVDGNDLAVTSASFPSLRRLLPRLRLDLRSSGLSASWGPRPSWPSATTSPATKYEDSSSKLLHVFGISCRVNAPRRLVDDKRGARQSGAASGANARRGRSLTRREKRLSGILLLGPPLPTLAPCIFSRRSQRAPGRPAPGRAREIPRAWHRLHDGALSIASVDDRSGCRHQARGAR